MSEAIVTSAEREGTQGSTTTLQHLCQNTLILSQIVSYLPPHSRAKLLASSRCLRNSILATRGVHRHLDLTAVKRVRVDLGSIDLGGEVWRNVQLDENVTEDDFYAGPLRGLFSTLQRQNILQDVQTLILDGLSVTADLCHDIINDSRFNVRILSIRGVRNLNHGKLRGSLQYACRPSRERDPSLKGLYLFGRMDDDAAPAEDQTGKAQTSSDGWWDRKGPQWQRSIPHEWVNCLVACRGIIAFDAVLCEGPRHCNSPVPNDHNAGPDIALYSLSGCEGCGKAPEGMTTASSSTPANLPLLTPPPITSSSLRAATTPSRSNQTFVPRCAECVRERYCHCCNKWWCESCYKLPSQAPEQEPAILIMDESYQMSILEELGFEEVVEKTKSRVTKSCWECGNNCEDCIDKTQRVCKKCCAGYCTVHNEGSSSEFCDWCVSRGRRLAKAKGVEGSPPSPGVLRDFRHLDHMRRAARF